MSDEYFISAAKNPIAGDPRCPTCGRPADGATSFNNVDEYVDPQPGDLALCLYCGAFLRYDESMRPELLSRAEWRRIARSDPGLRDLMEVAEMAARAARKTWH
jgi:hypothetical protein